MYKQHLIFAKSCIASKYRYRAQLTAQANWPREELDLRKVKSLSNRCFRGHLTLSKRKNEIIQVLEIFQMEMR